MIRALVAGLLTVVTTTLVGTWVVLRGLSFLGDAMAHGVLPGIAVAVLVGASTTVGAVVSGAAMVAGIDLVRRRTRLSGDTAIGLLFVGMLALGVAIISRGGAYATDLSTILFGDAIAVGRDDIMVTLVAAVFVSIATIVGYRAFLALTYSEDTTATLGLDPARVHLAMLVLIGVAVVASFRTVGTLLVFALLVAPAATAALVARRVPVLMGVGMGVGGLAVVTGLLVSFHWGVAASPAIAVVSVALFFAVLAGKEIALPVQRARARTSG
ncbi:metal ABC transporter permease [Nitriliruptoria bacterium AS10]|nr:metal ABC transporter permease [Salsipaludibacter albus]MBY5161159.1 metal ABC transporter permease [Salsipaludibacter albus]